MSRSKPRSHCLHSCGMCSPGKGKTKGRLKKFRKREQVILSEHVTYNAPDNG